MKNTNVLIGRMEDVFYSQCHSGFSGSCTLGMLRQIADGECSREEFLGYLNHFKELGKTEDHRYNILIYQSTYDLMCMTETDEQLRVFYDIMNPSEPRVFDFEEKQEELNG